MPADEPAFQPEAILEVLARYSVECVVIGATAAFLQGSPFPTTDVDITPKVDPANYARLSAALTELDAKVRAEGTEPLPFSHSAESLADASIWNLATKFGDLDITTVPSGTNGYGDLRRDAIAIKILGDSVRIASLADIVRSKDAAGRAKDQRMLPVLRELASRETKANAERRRRKPPTL
ncbi:MAG TPA: hypothetical protein VHE57_12030 [Mycobacteriales bacterium]|nr:hypothetical protein [Mycobacteriales bacterium]